MGPGKHCQADVFRDRVAVRAVGQDNERLGESEHIKQTTHGRETVRGVGRGKYCQADLFRESGRFEATGVGGRPPFKSEPTKYPYCTFLYKYLLVLPRYPLYDSSKY